MLRLPSLIQQPPRDLIAAPISAFESETQAVFVRTSPYSDHAVMHALAGICLITVLLMSVVKLDRVVTSSGRLMPTRGTLYVQPFDRAVIRQIKVHTGDIVKEGQALAELDPTFAQADLKQQQDHLATLSALATRLESELVGKPYEGGASPPEQLQLSIWHQRQAELQQSIADFDARIRSDESTILRSQQDLQAYTRRLDYAKQYTAMQETLERDGNTSKVKVLGAHDAEAEAERQVTEARNTFNGAQHDLEALRAQRAVAIGKWHDDTGTQLTSARDELQQTQQALSKANRISDLITLRAPEDSVVLDIGQASTNSVVDAGGSVKPLFTLVPINGPLEAEIEIPGPQVGFIRVGDPVQVKIDAFPYMRHGTAKGTITNISDGSFTANDTEGQHGTFFKAKVRIDSNELRNVPAGFRLIPGMTVQGDVLIGKRTILSYIMSAGLRTSSEAMREP